MRPLLDEREQDGLAVPHAQAKAEVLLHVLGIDDEAVHQAREQAEHVIEQRAGVGEDDALDAAVADVALVPEGDVFQRGHGVAAQHAREAGEAFPGDGVALVRHGAAAFLAFGERLFGFEHFGALQVAELHRPTLDARADERQRELEFGVDVALHDLRGDGRGAQAELLANVSLDARREVRARADGAGDFADRHGVAADSRRRRARPNSSCISASFRPKVVGSPWMPWLRPMQGVNLCSFARRAMTGSSFFTSAMRMSALCIICTA